MADLDIKTFCKENKQNWKEDGFRIERPVIFSHTLGSKIQEEALH